MHQQNYKIWCIEISRYLKWVESYKFLFLNPYLRNLTNNNQAKRIIFHHEYNTYELMNLLRLIPIIIFDIDQGLWIVRELLLKFHDTLMIWFEARAGVFLVS